MRPFSRSTENSYVFTGKPPWWKLLFGKVTGLIIVIALKITIPNYHFYSDQ